MLILKITALLLVLVTIWFFIERRLLLTTRKTLLLHAKGVPDGLKICHVSDSHLKHSGFIVAPLLKAVKREQPDIIVITGDLVSRGTTDFSFADELLCGLAAFAPVYFIYGNHECDLDVIKRRSLDALLQKAGVTVLDGESAIYAFNGVSFSIAGFVPPVACYHDEYFEYKELLPCTSDMLYEAFGEKEGFTLLLAHNPLFGDAYSQWGAELVLCGHVHGGMVRLPFIGGLLSPERRFFPKYSAGSYKLGNTLMFVSRGLGRLRLFNPREVVFLTLRAE